MKSSTGLRLATTVSTLAERTWEAFTLAGPRYYRHDERWGCDLDILRSAEIPPKPRILELGAGVGLILRICAYLFPDYRKIVGVDYCELLCRQAEKELRPFPNVRIVNQELEAFLPKARSASADVVLLLNNTLGNCWSSGTLGDFHHAILTGIGRVLSPNGLALVSVYSSEGVGLGRYGNALELVEDIGDGSFIGRVHRGRRSETFFCHLFDREELPTLACGAGLEVRAAVERSRRLIYILGHAR